MHRVAGMVPRQRVPRPGPLIIERQIAFDLLVGLSRIFLETFVTSTIRCRVILVGTPLFHIRLRRVMRLPLQYGLTPIRESARQRT